MQLLNSEYEIINKNSSDNYFYEDNLYKHNRFSLLIRSQKFM